MLYKNDEIFAFIRLSAPNNFNYSKSALNNIDIMTEKKHF